LFSPESNRILVCCLFFGSPFHLLGIGAR
jgi:hypothetical protein